MKPSEVVLIILTVVYFILGVWSFRIWLSPTEPHQLSAWYITIGLIFWTVATIYAIMT